MRETFPPGLVAAATRNVGWLLLDSVLRLAMTFAVVVWAARVYGPADFGAYSYALAITSVLAVVAGLGLDGIVVREAVERPTDRDEILGSAFLLKALAGGSVFALAGAALLFARVGPSSSSVRWTLLAASASLLFRPFDVIDFLFQSKVASRHVVAAKIAAGFLANLLRIALLLRAAPVVLFAWTYAIEFALIAAGFAVVYTRHVGPLSAWTFVRVPAVRMLSDAFPLILSSLAVVTYMRIDQLLIERILGTPAVGVYAAAQRISEIWYYFPMAIVPTIFPGLLEARRRDPIVYARRLEGLYLMMTVPAVLFALVLSLSAPALVNFLYGPAYREAARVLPIQAWSGVLVGLGVASSSYLTAENLTSVSFLRTFLGAVANLGLNLLLLPRLGILGAAIAMLVSQAIAVFSIGVSTSGRPQVALMLRAFFVLPAARRLLRTSPS